MELVRLVVYVFARPWQPQTNIYCARWGGQFRIYHFYVSQHARTPRNQENKSENQEVTEKRVTYPIPAAIHPPRNTQIQDSHRLYTFGFQPFSSSSALLAFSPASRTSLSILSLALKILLCK